MSNGAVAGSSSGAAAAAAIANAIKASGVLVRVEPNDFLAILYKMDEPLVVSAQGGLFSTKYKYLTSYKGLAFFTKSSEPLQLPGKAELVTAGRIWIPN